MGIYYGVMGVGIVVLLVVLVIVKKKSQ